MTQEMTITKALSELKLLDKRINRKIDDAVFISFKKGELGKLPNGLDEKEFGKNVEADYNSIADLIKRRNKIKASIVKSNAETVVNISGKDYTVAEAIERKNSIEYEIALLKKLKHDYSEVFRYVHEENEDVKRRLDDSLKSILSREVEQDNDFINEFVENFNKKNEFKIVDPINITKLIDGLENEIEDFLTEVDHSLSVSNATTIITI